MDETINQLRVEERNLLISLVNLLENEPNNLARKIEIKRELLRKIEQIRDYLLGKQTETKEKLKEVEEKQKSFEEFVVNMTKSLENLTEAIKPEKLFDGLREAVAMDDRISDVFNARRESDLYRVLYRVSKDLKAVNGERKEDHVYTTEQFEALEDQVIKWFTNLKNFASEYQWEMFSGVQFNLTGNPKIYKILQELSDQGNLYIRDFLIFDLIQMGQHVDPSYLEKAKELFLSVPDPSVLPLNITYRAILFDYYTEFVKNSKENPFTRCFEWNISPTKIIDEINRQGLTFKGDEMLQMEKWLVEATLRGI